MALALSLASAKLHLAHGARFTSPPSPIAPWSASATTHSMTSAIPAGGILMIRGPQMADTSPMITESDPNVVGGTYLASPDGPAPGLRSKFGSGPNWSPDGTGVTFTGSSSSNPYDTCEVFTAAVPDGEPVPLAKGVRSAWSPRGDLIAFTVNNEVHVISPDGSNERALASGGASGGTPLRPLVTRWQHARLRPFYLDARLVSLCG